MVVSVIVNVSVVVSVNGCGISTVTPRAGSDVDTSQLAHSEVNSVEDRDAEGDSVIHPAVALDWQQWTVPVVHHQAVMLGMRLTEVWLWPEPFAETRSLPVALRYRNAVSDPPKWTTDADWFEWDGDRWWINAVGHSLFGSELYLAARRCEFGVLPSFALAAVGSAAWEYGYEANGVRPSALDLVYTPVSGLVLGEFRHWAYRGAERLPDGPLRVLVRGLMDPFGVAERAFGAPC